LQKLFDRHECIGGFRVENVLVIAFAAFVVEADETPAGAAEE
jgi:hypothetical protein